MKVIPATIAKGMKVFDRSHSEIGAVEDFRFSENEDEPDIQPAELDRESPTDHSLIKDLAEALVPNHLPEVLRERLMLEGYVRIAPRGIGAHRFVLPEHIAAVTGNTLSLNVDWDQLIKV